MERADILKELFDEKIVNILSLFLKQKEKQFYLREVSTNANVSVATTFRILNRLVNLGFIEETQIGKFRVYKLARGEKARFVESMLGGKKDSPLDNFVEKSSRMARLKKIILQSQDAISAKLLLIGELLSSESVKKICKEIKSEHNFEISCLNLSQTQVNSMKDMGLYKEGRVLWERK